MIEAKERQFLGALAALFAKLASADGGVTGEEAVASGATWQALGLSPEENAYCYQQFKSATNTETSLQDCATELLRGSYGRNAKSLVYGALWELACADGILHRHEAAGLKNLVGWLGVRKDSYNLYYAKFDCGSKIVDEELEDRKRQAEAKRRAEQRQAEEAARKAKEEAEAAARRAREEAEAAARKAREESARLAAEKARKEAEAAQKAADKAAERIRREKEKAEEKARKEAEKAERAAEAARKTTEEIRKVIADARRASEEARRKERERRAALAHGMQLGKAYAVFGCSRDDSVETLRRAYRTLALKYHPDRAGVSPEEAARATERMAVINAAWAMIREERGIG